MKAPTSFEPCKSKGDLAEGSFRPRAPATTPVTAPAKESRVSDLGAPLGFGGLGVFGFRGVVKPKGPT